MAWFDASGSWLLSGLVAGRLDQVTFQATLRVLLALLALLALLTLLALLPLLPLLAWPTLSALSKLPGSDTRVLLGYTVEVGEDVVLSQQKRQEKRQGEITEHFE